ncbi:short transient receptor potential channel 3 [Nematostella vectensis]|uniref:short transient receptor potential channel 3 n=1 Tax=Nematostella vectensis TaxID=45351 RepID=UPI0013900A5F|nr:short transient receptor potential channel 3 [Nematostella vectensis]
MNQPASLPFRMPSPVEEFIDGTPLATIQAELTDAAPSPGTLLTSNENAFLVAVRRNDLESVRTMVAPRSHDHSSGHLKPEMEQHERGIDVNCMDSTGETALQIAVKNDSIEMIRLLLKNGADVGAALLQAVSKDNVLYVKALLAYENNNDRFSRRSSSCVNLSKNTNDSNRYMTPLILASHNNSYDIVKLLLSKGHTIDRVHDRGCLCPWCQSLGRIGTSLHRLYTYRALASPVYMSLTFLSCVEAEHLTDKIEASKKDPVRQAFELNKELVELADIEYEFRSDYLQLSQQCEEFAVALLDQCRDMSEIEQMMSVPDMDGALTKNGSKSLGVLDYAINNKNGRFVAHPYCQMMLNSVIYGDFHTWEKMGVTLKILFALLFTIFIPVWAIVYFFTPTSCLSQKLATPILKFIMHTGAFGLFLLLLILSSVEDLFFDPLRITPLDILITIWIFGLIVQELKDMWRQGKERYLSQWWNLVTLAMLGLFIISGILWVAGSALSVSKEGSLAVSFQQVLGLTEGIKESYRFILLANAFFTIGVLLAFLHFSNAVQVNSTLGPLQLSLVKMVKDILKFLLLFFLIYLAFVVALRRVYSQYVWAGKTFLNQTSTTSEFASVQGSMRLVFWAIFDKTELEEFNTDPSFPTKITQSTGEVLFALFNIASILVAINMLIAMMSNSFQKVADSEDFLWKFSRTRMWMEYIIKGSVLPAPFSVLPSIASIINFFRSSKYCCRFFTDEVITDGPGFVDDNFRITVVRRLIERYFYNIEKAKDNTNPSHVGVELTDLTLRMRDLVEKLKKHEDDPEIPADKRKELQQIVKLWKETERKHLQIESAL